MIEIDKDIYQRSSELNDRIMIPNSVCIIGVGGVGGWVAFKFPLLGINNIILIDPDTLEESNLNRLPYKYDQIGEYKVHAMQELIRERRMCNVQALPMKWEDIPQSERDAITNENGSNTSIIIDCRDTITPLEGVTDSYITGGYDGSSVTIHTSPNFNNVWGEDQVGYRITPSYLIPPDLISTLIINFICYEMHQDASLLDETVLTFDVGGVLGMLKRGNSCNKIVDEPVVEVAKPKRKRSKQPNVEPI